MGLTPTNQKLVERLYAEQVRAVHTEVLRELGFRTDGIREVKKRRLNKLAPRSIIRSIFQKLVISVDRQVAEVARVSASGFAAVDLGQIVEQNVGLIQTATTAHLNRLTRLIEDDRILSLSNDEATVRIQRALKVSESRARFWARDQALKFNAGVTRQRAKGVGLDRYEWVTTGVARPDHADLEGQIFSFDSPPVTNANGDRNNPGEDYNCRCVALLVV